MAYDDPFDRRRTPPAVAPSYLAWLAVIIVGVTVGNLLSTYITARITAYQAEAAMAELQRSMQTQAGQARAAAAEAARRDAERQAAQKREAEEGLSAALPALESAAEALQNLKKDDITEIRSFAKPHELVCSLSMHRECTRRSCR